MSFTAFLNHGERTDHQRNDDPDGAMFRQIRERMQLLETGRVAKLEELDSFNKQHAEVHLGSPELLDELPFAGQTDLTAAPEHVLRRLLEAFRLEVRYHKPSSWANCRVAIREEGLGELVADSTLALDARSTSHVRDLGSREGNS